MDVQSSCQWVLSDSKERGCSVERGHGGPGNWESGAPGGCAGRKTQLPLAGREEKCLDLDGVLQTPCDAPTRPARGRPPAGPRPVRCDAHITRGQTPAWRGGERGDRDSTLFSRKVEVPPPPSSGPSPDRARPGLPRVRGLRDHAALPSWGEAAAGANQVLWGALRCPRSPESQQQ